MAGLSGTTVMEINKASAPANDQAVVNGALNYGGTLVITNSGTKPLAVGDKFTLFNKPGAGAFANVVFPGGYVFTNRLAVDGSVAVTAVTVSTAPTNLTWQASGGSLTLSWPTSYLGWRLFVQTNSIATGLSTNWVPWPGSSLVTQTNLPINPANPAVFFRLAYP